jgi:hypothetical protein
MKRFTFGVKTKSKWLNKFSFRADLLKWVNTTHTRLWTLQTPGCENYQQQTVNTTNTRLCTLQTPGYEHYKHQAVNTTNTRLWKLQTQGWENNKHRAVNTTNTRLWKLQTPGCEIYKHLVVGGLWLSCNMHAHIYFSENNKVFSRLRQRMFKYPVIFQV